MSTKALRVLYWDHLSLEMTSLQEYQSGDVVLLVEAQDFFTQVKHHKQKIAFLISAMRHFALELKSAGYKVCYQSIEDAPVGDLIPEIERAYETYKCTSIVATEPSDYASLQALKACKYPVKILSDARFLCRHNEFSAWAEGRRELRLEFFYRMMRKKHQILMKDGQPVGGKWNYDSENRKFPTTPLQVPARSHYTPDEITKKVLDLVAKRFSHHFGTLTDFAFAVTRAQAQTALQHFIDQRLPQFGDWQDVMLTDEPWLFHAHLSFYLNCGLLTASECIDQALKAYTRGQAPLNAVEGFIRQILGWREFVRGLYWLKMPAYKQSNYLNAQRPLPKFYWTTETSMACLRSCLTATQRFAYAHHIQRLMVLGNFALLAGLSPEEVNEWYLIVYADAFEWVELPNVTGMILFADGGLLGSKPYAASGAYIHKMSDYCQNCVYRVQEKNGPKACPFNYLYWNFLIKNEDKLGQNARLRMVYATLRKMSAAKKALIVEDAARFLEAL